MTSLAASLRDIPSSFSGYAASSIPEGSVIAQLEDIAMKESGADFSVTPSPGYFYHHFLNLSFDPYKKRLRSEGLPLFKNLKGIAGIYFPQVTISEITPPEIAMKSLQEGISYVIINDNSIHDINNALFVDHFYKLLQNGIAPIDSFYRSKRYIQKNRKLKHPAYWQALRIYCNGM